MPRTVVACFVVLLSSAVLGEDLRLSATPVRIPIEVALPDTDSSTVVISIYERKDSIDPLWTEEQVLSRRENPEELLAGAASPDGVPPELFTSGKARWIGIAINGQPEQPRIMLLAVPYAAHAGDARTLGGRAASDFVSREELKEQVRSLMTEGAASQAPVPSMRRSSSVVALPPTAAAVGLDAAGSFEHQRTTGTTTGVYGSASSTTGGTVMTAVSGVLGEVLPTAPGSWSAGVRGLNFGTGAFGIGVLGRQAGTGWGVYGEAETGTGVYGVTRLAGTASGAAGVRAAYAGGGVTGVALEISNGAIRVAGPVRPAFIHEITAANVLTDPYSGNVATMIDNPMCNNEPGALLFVTLRLDSSGDEHTSDVITTYNGAYNRWFLWRRDGVLTVGARYNILVIKQ